MKLDEFKQAIANHFSNLEKIEANNYAAPEMKAHQLAEEGRRLITTINQRTMRHAEESGEIIHKPEHIRADELRVLVTDVKGNTYHKDWKKTAKIGECIRWTLEGPDTAYYITEHISRIEIIPGEEPI